MWGCESVLASVAATHFLLVIYPRILKLRLKGKGCPQQTRRCRRQGLHVQFLMLRLEYKTLKPGSWNTFLTTVETVGGE